MIKRVYLLLTFILLLTSFHKAEAQHEIRIQGGVRDVTTNSQIGGVSIIHNGGQVAFTDVDGKYSAFVPSNAELLFYKPEYNDYVVNVENRQILNINMTINIVELGEAIVVGKMSKKTIVVDQTELEVVGNYFHLKTKFRVPKRIFTSDKRFVVQPTLFNVTRQAVEYFRPLAIDGEVYKMNRARVLGFEEDKDVLEPYIAPDSLEETDYIYPYHDSIFVSREYFEEDFRAECFLAVNANYENPRRDFLDTVIIARGTQNPLRVAVKYNLNDLEWTQFGVMEGISQNDKFKTVQKYIVEHNQGKVRYTIRLMSVPTRVESADSPVREYTFVEEVSESRDIYRELDAPPGEYRVMVWADYMKEDSEESYYDASNFAQITFNGLHSCE